MGGSTANKSILISEDNIEGVGRGNVIDKANVVDKVNPEFSESKTGFFTPGSRLSFTKLRQAFSTTPILHYCDPEYHI